MAKVLDFNKAKSQQELEEGRTLMVASPIDVANHVSRLMSQEGYGNVNIELDGRLHRFSLKDDVSGEKTGWYIGHADSIPCVVWGRWDLPGSNKVLGTDADLADSAVSVTLTQTQIDQALMWADMQKEERIQESIKRDQKACIDSYNIFANAREAYANHPYLQRKKISRVFGGIKEETYQNERVLLIPMYNVDATFGGFQRIFPDGRKRFFPGIHKKGRLGIIQGKDFSRVLLCEGYATACSLHEATGFTVLIAFDASNLVAVAEHIRESQTFAKSEFLVCADNDAWHLDSKGKIYNIGVHKGEEAARILGASIIYPEFLRHDGQPTDFNDLAQLQGIAEVANQVLDCGNLVPQISSWGINCYSGKAPKQEWLVEGMLPLPVPALLAAAGGTGKGMLTLDLALRIAGPEPETPDTFFDFNTPNIEDTWLGNKIVNHGSVVIITAEDSGEDVHRRLEAIDPDGSRRLAAEGRLFIVPLPNSGGPFSLIRSRDGYEQGYEDTQECRSITRQLRTIEDLKLVILDPLSSFVSVDINKDPMAGSFVQGRLAAMSKELGATIMYVHHMNKIAKDKGQMTIEDARNAVRGTSALVDGVRLVIAIWPGDKKSVEKVEQVKGCKCNFRNVFNAAVVKSNCPADIDIHTLLRESNGLLKAVDFGEYDKYKPTREEEKDMLVEAIRLSTLEGESEEGAPAFTKTGMDGIFERRTDLPPHFHNASKRHLWELMEELCSEKRLFHCSASVGSKSYKYYDVLDGPFYRGVGKPRRGNSKIQEDD